MFEAVKKNESAKANDKKIFDFIKFTTAIGGIAGGLVFMLSGLILTVISRFSLSDFRVSETILIAAAFVLLAVGAHFLDLIERDGKLRKKQKLNL